MSEIRARVTGIPDREELTEALHGLKIPVAGASGFLMTTASAEQTADLIIARLYELAAGPAPLYQTAALNLRYRLRCNVEQSDGTWGGADTVAEVCQWMNEQGVSPEQDAT